MVKRIVGLLLAFLGSMLLLIGMDTKEEHIFAFSFAFSFPSIVFGLKMMVS